MREGERFYYSDALGSTTSLASGNSLTARNEYSLFVKIKLPTAATYCFTNL